MQDPFVFIVGSPRSGTTVLGEILDHHDHISQWYEPYFIWDRHFRLADHDQRSAEDATPKVIGQVSKDFYDYRDKTKSRIVVDKSPRNSLKIPFIQKIFPQARFIHILRDGRDTTLSIHREWLRRQNVVHGSDSRDRFQYRQAFDVVTKWLGRQRFIKQKASALWFETRLHLFDKTRHLNRIRWNGQIGWGPRFNGWQEVFADTSLLQFNAYQWATCVDAITASWPLIDEKKKITIQYEKMITEPKETLDRILSFLGVTAEKNFLNRIPRLKSDNYNKWKTQFSREQLLEIKDVVSPLLVHFGYEHTDDWLPE